MDVGEETGSAAKGEGLLDPGLVFHALPGSTREEVLEQLVSRLSEQRSVRDAGQLASRLLERERLGSTGLGGGIAIPHCKFRGLDDCVVAAARTEHPIDFGAADGIPVSLIFLVVSPEEAPAAHLHTLARISRLLRAPGVAEGLRRADCRAKLLNVLREAEAGLAVAQ